MPVAVVARLGERLPLVVPWRTIGLLLVAAPLLAAAVTTVAARLSLRSTRCGCRPRRSTPSDRRPRRRGPTPATPRRGSAGGAVPG